MSATLSHYLNQLLSNTYALALKTKNYHWHVKGPNFYSLHKFLDEQYGDLTEAVDRIAERIVQLGDHAAATLPQLQELSTLSDGNSKLSSQSMLADLLADHAIIIKQLREILTHITEHDAATDNLICDRLEEHEKMSWMLAASIEH